MLKLSQQVPVEPHGQVVELFCDARGTPPRLAAVLFHGKKNPLYTDLETPPALLALFAPRRDAQIMGQELLAIALGLCSFGKHLKHKCVRVWTDNKGGECALRWGSARAGDHNLLVHALWLLAAREGFGLWVERVPERDVPEGNKKAITNKTYKGRKTATTRQQDEEEERAH